ncbi:ABC transporter permease subunit [Jatrophihabitans sp. YIM 134969]
MTATAAATGRHARVDDTASAPRPSLVRAELLRLRSRRLLRVLLALVVLGWLAATVVAVFTFAEPGAADLDRARAQIAQIVADNETYRTQCLADPPDGDESFCGPPTTAADFSPNDFVPKSPFELDGPGRDGALVTAVGVAVVAVVAGATWIGGEWSSRSMVGLLFWEPRRWRVHLVKAAVVTVAAAVVAVLAEALWTASAYLLANLRGDGAAPDGFVGQLLGLEARGVALVACCALIGYAVAGLVRNTGATLGIAFVYFAVVETAVRAVWDAAQAGLVTVNAVALVARGGYTYYTYDDVADGTGPFSSQQHEHVVSNLQGGLVLAGVAVVLTAVSGWVLARRDVQ